MKRFTMNNVRWTMFLLFMGLSMFNAQCSMVFAQNDAMYIYRNDGIINAFLKTEIDSIRHSALDLDSVMHAENVTQEVWTVDTVYRIPLVAIDSVSFVTPETKYKPSVIRIEEELRDYVLRQDSLTIYFSGSIPSSMIPHVGDKLVTLEMSDIFPIGFAGEVEEIKNTSDEVEVVCTAVSLEEVFDCFYGYSEMGWDGKNLVRLYPHDGRRKAEATFSPGKLTLNLVDELGWKNSYQPNDELAYDLSELRSDISVTPVVWGSAFTIVHPFYGVNIKLTVTGKYSLEENFSLKGGVSWKKDIPLLKLPPPYYDRLFWAIAPLVDFYIKPGVFIQAGGEFAIQQTWTQEYRSVFHYEYSSRGEQSIDNVNKVFPISSNHSGEAALDGNIGAGFFIESGFDFIHTRKADLANAYFRVEAGVNLEGSLVLTKNDMEDAMTSTAIYEQLRDTELRLNWFYGLSGNATFWKWGISHDVNLPGIKLNNQGKIFSMALAPTFSDVKATRTGGSSNVNAEAKISCPAFLGGRCLKVDAGFILKDEDGEDVTSLPYSLNGYDGSQGTKEIKQQFSDVPLDGKGIKAYPRIKWMGVDVLASPCAELEQPLCPDDNHPHAIDLGLPSGTKWCCCNMGASMPEGYGGYYAWGETSEKATYTKENYRWHHVKEDGTYVFENTTYDIAPSLEDVSELNSKCAKVETVLEGVKGIMYTGSNGNKIFLPYGGLKDVSLHYFGEEDHYWTNQLPVPTRSAREPGIEEDEGIPYAYDWYDLDWRYLGKNVRQVIKQ